MIYLSSFMLSNKQVKNPNIYPYNVFRGKYIEPYDEKRYTNALAEMVQHSIDFEDTHKIITECQ